MTRKLLWLTLLSGFLFVFRPIFAQTDCGVVDEMIFPVDQSRFQLVQTFAAANVRHLGKFHTGEDWYGGRGTSLGQPVKAAARGRVTYSNPEGWGIDGGVVILEHVMPDEELIYTVYGHLMSTPTFPFPDRLTCVEAGQIIGAITDARPAPHVHFEVRLQDPTAPGPGYTTENPFGFGWRDPSKFFINWQAWLQDAHEWHLLVDDGIWATQQIGLAAPPLMLNDSSLLYLNRSGTTLRRATYDGRILWRNQIERAVAVLGWEGQTLVVFANGCLNPMLDYDTGRLGEGWCINKSLAGAPIEALNTLIFPTSDGGLLALADDRRTILWEVSDIPRFVRAQVAVAANNFVIGLMTENNELLVVASSGVIIDRKQLTELASLGTTPNGQLLVYSKGGLWQVDIAGKWSLYIPDAPGGGEQGALLATDGGRTFLYDGTRLYAYGTQRELLWSSEIGAITNGRAELALYETVLLLTSADGHVIAVNDGGKVCAQMHVYGSPQARQWQQMGNDGNILRLLFADQLLGINWGTFTEECR